MLQRSAAITATIIWLLFLVPLAGAAQKAVMVDEQSALARIEIKLGHTRLVRLKDPATRITVGKAKVADVVAISPRQFSITANEVGSTNISLWSSTNRLTGVIEVRVGHDLSVLKQRLHEVLPDEPVEVRDLRGAVVISGRLSSLSAQKKAEALAEAFAPKKVASLLEVGGGAASNAGGAHSRGQPLGHQAFQRQHPGLQSP